MSITFQEWVKAGKPVHPKSRQALPMARQRAGGVDPRKARNPQAPYLDLLQCAWHLTDDEMERVASLPEGFIWAWRNNRVALDLAQLCLIDRLSCFHDALLLVVPLAETDPGPPNYGDYLRRRWSDQSPIGARSILEAIFEDGPDVIDLLTGYFWSQR